MTNTITKYTLVFTALIILTGFRTNAFISWQGVTTGTGGITGNLATGLAHRSAEIPAVQGIAGGGTIITEAPQQAADSSIGWAEPNKDDYCQFAIYPNPATDNFSYSFQLPETGSVSIFVSDELGQKTTSMLSISCQNGKQINQIDLSDFAAGNYLVTMIFTSATTGEAHISSKKLEILK
jgi:hypothetical protein